MLLNRKRNIIRLSNIAFLVFLSLLSLAVVQCVQVQQAITALEPTVAFELSASSGSEAVSKTRLAVKLSAASSQTVTVGYAVTDTTASNTTLGSGKDYALTHGTLTFKPGITTKNIFISIVNDSINEADETIKVTLSNPSNAIMGTNTSHTYTIIDNDRKSIVDVKKDFGAAGDGITNDTTAIQKAINATYNRGGGVILFPPGVYIVTSVDIRENITYQGYGATIERPDMQGKWTRTFTTKILYAGKVDSKPLIIKGFTFDGNSQRQGSYQNGELEQAHLIFLEGNTNYPGRLKAVVEDCIFKNGVADGISVYSNVFVKVHNCEAIDVFRGGFVLTGGYSSAEVYKLKTRGEIDDTGIDIEVDGKGYGGTLKVDVKLEDINLIDGDFDIAVQDSNVIGNNIIADAPFYIFNLNSTMKFTNSKFKVGATDGYMNRIVFPGKLIFNNCEFYVTRKKTKRAYSFFSAADIWWQHSSASTQKNQLLIFNNCQFKVDDNIQKQDKTYAIYSREDAITNNNVLKIQGVNISEYFDIKVFRESGQ